ncbi:ribonuclease P protein subunit [Nitrosopumilus sp.]|nr:ribonuclease P protein subunit [Nitrosopumilus sp.]
MITADTISRHEFIGLDTKVINSSNSEVVGLNGTVINETKSMFTINTEKGMKMIPKSTNDWRFTINGKSMTVKGSTIVKRPFERIGAKA